MTKGPRPLLLVLLCCLLAGCTSVDSIVTRTHDLGPANERSVYLTWATDEYLPEGVRQRHGTQVSNLLKAAGFTLVTDETSAALIAILSLGSSPPDITYKRVPIYGVAPSIPVYHHGHGVKYIYVPPPIIGYGREAVVLHNRSLTLKMSADPENEPPEFFSKVSSQSRREDVADVLGCMVQALFQDFPGESGRTFNVEQTTLDCDL